MTACKLFIISNLSPLESAAQAGAVQTLRDQWMLQFAILILKTHLQSHIFKLVLEGRRIAFGASRKRKVRTPQGVMPRNSSLFS
jgi:hypothetical protein